MNWWRWVAATLAPNPRILLFVALGWIAELALLGRVQNNIYGVSPRARWLAVMGTAWVWLTIGWILWWVGNRLTGKVSRALWRTLLAVIAGLYGLSWGVYLRTSRFPDGEAVSFAVGNFRLLWLYVRQAEHGIWYVAAAILVAVAGAAIAGGRWLSDGRWSTPDNPAELRYAQRVTWYCLGIAVSLLFLQSSVGRDIATVRRERDAVRNYLDPVVTMAGSWITSQVYERVEPCINPSELRPLSQIDAWNKTSRITNRANVILITVESMRHDVIGLHVQGTEVMPMVDELASGGVCFTRTYSQSSHSDYANTALYSSLFPLRTVRHLYFHDDDPWPKTLIYDLLKRAGYATAVVSSQNERWGQMDNFLKSPLLDLFYDPVHGGGLSRGPLNFDNLPDSQTMDRALAWVAEQNTKATPFFLGLNLQTSHFPYTLPADAEKPFEPATIDFPVGFFEYPADKVEIMRNAYYNALHECDRQIRRLIDALRRDGLLSRTVILISGDHGEAFYERGYVTHAREPIEPVIRTACVLYAPGVVTPRVDDYPVELVDVLPMFLTTLGLPAYPGFQGIDVLASDRPPLNRRMLFIHTDNPSTRTDGVLWMGRWKYVHDRLHDEESLFDVESDSGEASELSARYPALLRSLREVTQTWRRRQLAYYQFPMYYEHYLPPAPPPPPSTAVVPR
ncbi:MAG TPA: sulfatase [Verrucomicrobiae bacterium]|nr:sulfatase [Verrucomicrobiae bacterium]